MKTVNTNVDTIAAISTPFGEGGIGIVRLSGPQAVTVTDRLFKPASGKFSLKESHTVNYGHIRIPGSDDIIDEVLVILMRAPRSYTKEDVVEINCHSGSAILKKILQLCTDAGARLAEPGEFTKRAFLNGRIDLLQAESVLDVIKAETDTAEKNAIRQLTGDLSCKINGLRDSILKVQALIELSIDFSEEDVEFSGKKDILRKLKKIIRALRDIVKTFGKGIMLREGVNAVICGKPNVGKSSLMNALLRDDRVIVTPVAGTTRDVIEEYINIAGIKVRLSDTAGIIETKDRVEIEGIKRSKEKLKNADIVIFMLDKSKALSKKDEEIFGSIKGKKKVIVANKSDLPSFLDMAKAKKIFGDTNIIEASILKLKNLEKIEAAIEEELLGGETLRSGGLIITNTRHKKALEETLVSLERAREAAEKDLGGELLASDLKDASAKLGTIMGQEVDEDILDRIFSRFCIGK